VFDYTDDGEFKPIFMIGKCKLATEVKEAEQKPPNQSVKQIGGNRHIQERSIPQVMMPPLQLNLPKLYNAQKFDPNISSDYAKVDAK